MYSQKTAVDEQNLSPYKLVIHHSGSKTETQTVLTSAIMRSNHPTDCRWFILEISDHGF